MKLSATDLKKLKEKNISIQIIESQIKLFQEGFPFLKIHRSASIEKGILSLNEEESTYSICEWEKYLKNNSKKIYKFVPASGAATRMFKDLFDFLITSENSEYINKFIKNINKFAFYDELDSLSIKYDTKTINQLIADNNIQEVINQVLNNPGLNYSNLPKGLIKFHSYPDYKRTALEEHLAEGYQYALTASNNINIHFTISPEHRSLFISLTDKIIPMYNKMFGVNYKISFSKQNPQTDTIAVDEKNTPVRDENGNLLFRPAGHGALLENLNAIDADIIFIKNIDNVVPDKYKKIETKYKKILAGYLLSVQSRIFNFLSILDSDHIDINTLNQILQFLEDTLYISKENSRLLDIQDLTNYLKEKLNRPIRVCGMVKNEGEAGGGPFFTENKDGSISLQILEDSQIDKKDKFLLDIHNRGSHFNPVDIVCGVKNYKGEKFNLLNHIDINTGFISYKSYKGKKIKALELPGLWNGSMSDWNTIFVEVPLETFNPVKTVNDLLKKHHQ